MRYKKKSVSIVITLMYCLPILLIPFVKIAMGADIKEIRQCWNDGTYQRLVKKYYPTVYLYYFEFFEGK